MRVRERQAAVVREAADLAKVSARTGFPVKSQGPVRNADGSLSARVGLEEMKYMVLTIDKDGKRTITHQTREQMEKATSAQATEAGEE